MTRTSRTGSRYAEGSHMTRGEYPADCAVCGKRVSLDNCWQEAVDDGRTVVRRTYHHGCRPRARG